MALTQIVPVWIALVALGLLVVILYWANQRDVALQASETRASQAESRAATAEAIVTAEAYAQAATATALAYASSPEAAVDRSLKLLLEAEREPTDQRLRSLNDAFGPAALAVVRPEVEHLLSGGLHLDGDSDYDLAVLAADLASPDQADVRTRERWIYDERNSADERVRCLVESGEQTYTLRKVGPDWEVDDIQLGPTSRVPCPDS
jgi:hypothetical protein